MVVCLLCISMILLICINPFPFFDGGKKKKKERDFFLANLPCT
jgi:hypothetical protein